MKKSLIIVPVLAVLAVGGIALFRPAHAQAVATQTLNFPRTNLPAGPTTLPALSVPLGTTEVSVAITDFTNDPNAVTSVETDISKDNGQTWQFDSSTIIQGSLTSVPRPTGDVFTLRSSFPPVVTAVRAHVDLSVPISLSATVTTR